MAEELLCRFLVYSLFLCAYFCVSFRVISSVFALSGCPASADALFAEHRKVPVGTGWLAGVKIDGRRGQKKSPCIACATPIRAVLDF